MLTGRIASQAFTRECCGKSNSGQLAAREPVPSAWTQRSGPFIVPSGD
jgi:hypothetical protein